MAASNTHSLKCWQCGEVQTNLPLPLSRHANCQKCYEVLHCCRFCIYYNEKARDACEEDDAETPHNKESANFCEFFKPNPSAYEGTVESTKLSTEAKLDALFGGEPQNNDSEGLILPTPDLRDSNPLDKLFDDD